MKYAVLDNENKCVAIVTMDLVPDSPQYIEITDSGEDVIGKTLVIRNGAQSFEGTSAFDAPAQMPVKTTDEKIDELNEQMKALANRLEGLGRTKIKR